MKKKETPQARFDRENTRKYGIKLNKRTDAELISKLDEQSSIQGYIKRLIREDIQK